MDLFNLDPGHHQHSNVADDCWWDRLIADSPLWSSEGSLARDDCPDGFANGMVASDAARDDAADGTTGGKAAGDQARSGGVGSAGSDRVRAAGAGNAGGGAGRDRGRSSWVLVGSVRESAQALALTPLPDDVDVCLAEAEDLMFARDRITCALADRVGRVHRAGQARQHGHASTRSWLRTAGGMSVPGAGRLLTLAVELARLPRVRERFAAGGLAAGVVEAICTATAQLSDEQAGLAEPILLELAGKAGAAEVAKAGRYLRAVLNPDGEDRDEQADYARRFLRVRPTGGGGLEGEFYLPREAAARLRTLLDAYAKPKAEGDDRPLRVRNADAFIAFLEEKIATELLVLVNAESLPADPVTDQPADANGTKDTGAPSDARSADDPGAMGDTGSAEDTDPGDADNTSAPGEMGATGDASADTEVDAGSDAAADAAESADRASTGPRAEEPRDPEAGEHGAREQRASEHGTRQRGACERERRDTASSVSAEGGDTVPAEGEDCDRASASTGATPAGHASAWLARGGSGHPHTAQAHTAHTHAAQPDPPPEGPPGHHAHAGHQPAGDCRHGQGTCEDHGEVSCGQRRHEPDRHEPDRDEQGGDEQGGDEQGRAQQDAADGQGACGCGGRARCSCGAPGTPGTAPGTMPGALPGAAPGLLLATGQMLPVSGVHRLARTSTLVRLVMDADGQVLDMGRKVRLATPAQRRAVFARYATCWIDGCPLTATKCQIDHADNWSTGGLTDLKLLGPACQFHNRDRYRHPDRYTRHKTGTDRWAFTYHNPIRARGLKSTM
ncbi:DUF222 domain-containing protein [Microbispora sp. CA-102843]|uniref:HNH endonuclease signature motif containing protein n=1 Tax=Microbispora sp. CA-102843 TaxID=3239952 RepID=UPI003D919021